MSEIRKRAKENFPAVLLTLVSIIQAIALESLWDHVSHHPELFEATWPAFLSWLQVAVTLNLIIMIWLIYVGLLLRMRWTPTQSDSALPFLVGLAEFAMIAMMGPDNLWAWVLIGGLLSVMIQYMIYTLMRRARRDPDNQEIFVKLSPATWLDHMPQFIPAILLILISIWLWRYGYNQWVALTVFLIALVAMTISLRIQARFWRISMGDD